MARIVTINPLLEGEGLKYRDFYRTTDKKSINLETVRSIASKQLEYKWVYGSDTGGDYLRVYLITFEYKNRCGKERFYVEQKEYERLKADLARHGWLI